MAVPLKAGRKRNCSQSPARKSRAQGPARSDPTFGCSFRHAVPAATRWRPCRCALMGVKSAKYFSPESFLAPCERRLPATSRISFRDGSEACDIGDLIKTGVKTYRYRAIRSAITALNHTLFCEGFAAHKACSSRNSAVMLKSSQSLVLRNVMSSRLRRNREPALRKSRAWWLFMKAHFDSYDIPISAHFRPSRFFMTFGPILRIRSRYLRPLFRWRWRPVA